MAIKDDYSKSVQLRCATCGDGNSFRYEDADTYIKCIKCNREYYGGYNELVELNQQLIEDELMDTSEIIKKDITESIQDSIKKMRLKF